MTAYVAVGTGGTTTNLAIVPGSYEIRIAQIVFSGETLSDSSPWFGQGVVTHYASGASGGTTVAPIAFRQGASAASSVARTGSVTGSGTAAQVFNQTGSGASNSANIGGTTTFANSFTLTFQPPFDLIISPGGALLATGAFSATGSPTQFVCVFFEELRLSWPY